MKKLLSAIAIAAALGCSCAAASPLVTADVPLDSSYYGYLDKLEGMGYIHDMPANTKPYSRLDMAKWVLQAEAIAQSKPLPPYLQTRLDAMREGLSEEIAYLQGAGKINNVKLRGASVDLSYLQQDSAAYKYNNAKAHWQLLNHNNNGYLYGDGFNAVGTLHISGSLSKDLAVGVTPRFSWDKDEHGDASLVEGYAKTHLGVWGITAGRQPMSWGVGRAGQLAFGSNATPQTAIKLNLLEPHTFDNGALKFLGKANVNVFASRLEGNRVASSGSALEKDHAALVGVRVDIMPTDAFTIGLERMSMLKKFNKHWLLGDNADDAEKDNWNDIAGLDFKYRFPGVQVYASLYGEDQAHAFPCENAYNVGMYFPQLVPDGSWDLRVEAAKTNDAWYGHWVLKNGWTYKDAILGDWLGADAKRVYAEVNHYLADGGKLGLSYAWADMQPTAQHDGRLQEVELSYSKSLQKDLLLHTAVGYGKLGDDTSKLVAVGLSWEY